MTSIGSDLENVLVIEREHVAGRPAARAVQAACAASARSTGPRDHRVPRRGGLLVGHDRRRRPRRQPRLADLLLRARRHHRAHGRRSSRSSSSRAMFIGMDPPKHDRLKALFQRGFTPKRIADHEERDPRDRRRRARPARGPRDLRPRHRRRPAGRLARDRQLHGHPAGGRRDLGAADELDRSAPATPTSTRRASRRRGAATCPRSSSAAGS